MELKKTLAATVVATTLGVGGLALTTAGGATATPSPTTTPGATSSTKGAFKGHRALRRRLVRGGVKVAAKSIGITPKALVAELRTGKSIAQVATAHGVPVSKVESDLTTAAKGVVTKALAAHKITAAEAAKIDARIPTGVDKVVNHVFKARK